MRLGSKRICSLFLIGSLFCVSGYADNAIPKAAAAKEIRGNSQKGNSTPERPIGGDSIKPFKEKGEIAERPVASKILRAKNGTIQSMIVGTGKNAVKVALVSKGIYSLNFEKDSDFSLWTGSNLVLGEGGAWTLTAKDGNTLGYNPLKKVVTVVKNGVTTEYSEEGVRLGSSSDQEGDGMFIVFVALVFVAYEIYTHAPT